MLFLLLAKYEYFYFNCKEKKGRGSCSKTDKGNKKGGMRKCSKVRVIHRYNLAQQQSRRKKKKKKKKRKKERKHPYRTWHIPMLAAAAAAAVAVAVEAAVAEVLLSPFVAAAPPAASADASACEYVSG
jgi:hypothetical protein